VANAQRGAAYLDAMASRHDPRASRFPLGGHEIARARDNGMRPAHAVIVSLCGWHERESNPQVVATGPNHDWAFLAGLGVFVFVNKDSEHVQRTLRALARPCERIDVWDVGTKRGMTIWPIWKGVNVPEVHYCPLEDRRDAIFLRWGRLTWLPSENRRFAE
jgi:hypothetical protein